MSWAARRRLFILLTLGSVIAVFLVIALTAAFYKAPSCVDGVQNQGEAGIDCGGPCPYLCTAEEQSPTVLFTQPLPNGSGRTDIIASVENKNIDAAARNVPYSIMLYGPGQSFLKEITGTLDLPPGATVPVYVPGALYGGEVASAFLDIASSSPKWFALPSDPRIVPAVGATNIGGTASAPRIEAVLTNPSVTMLTDVLVIILVRGTNGNVIAASQTVVPALPAQGRGIATFTWNSAFSDTPASIEVVPVVPLPPYP